MKKFLFWSVVTLLVALVVSVAIAHRLYGENLRLRHNQHALLQGITFYRTRADQSAARVEALEFEAAEFREYRRRDAEAIRALGVRLRRAESYAVSATASRYEATVVLHDTVIVRDTLRDTVRLFAQSDGWSSVAGRVHGDSISYSLRTIDTLRQVVHRVPRKFLFFRFGTKGIRQEIWSSNPHTELVYTEYVEFKRCQ